MEGWTVPSIWLKLSNLDEIPAALAPTIDSFLEHLLTLLALKERVHEK